MRLASRDIQGITKRLYKLDLFIFLESLKVLESSKVLQSLKVLENCKSFIKKKNKGFFITLSICLVILGMLDAASHLPTFRLYKAYSCYHNGMRFILIRMPIYHITTAKDISGYTMYYIDVI